jgi:putative two-component system response regulator
VTLLVGPLGAALGMPSDGPQAWLVRGLAFAGLGALIGLLFDRMRTEHAHAVDEAQRVVDQQREAIVAFARGAEAKDEVTGQHIVRVSADSTVLALAAGLDAAHAEQIGWSSMLHDIGKLHIPDQILLKPGPLDADEWALMRMHPVWGEAILGDGRTFEVARRIARWHHEDFDGSGYPDGLRGERIPLEARIVRVTDAFDAMTNDRPYASARSIEEALDELVRYAGRQFDPELAQLYIDIVCRRTPDAWD